MLNAEEGTTELPGVGNADVVLALKSLVSSSGSFVKNWLSSSSVTIDGEALAGRTVSGFTDGAGPTDTVAEVGAICYDVFLLSLCVKWDLE